MISPAIQCRKCNQSLSQDDRFCAHCGTAQTALTTGNNQYRTGELLSEKQEEMNQVRHRVASQMANEIAEKMPASPSAGAPQSTMVNVSTPQAVPMQTPAQTINFNMAQPSPVYQPTYYPPQKPSATFVILTFVMYIVLFPLGAIMNWVGLLCGPHRGWHAAMLFFIQLPSVLLCIAITILFATGALP